MLRFCPECGHELERPDGKGVAYAGWRLDEVTNVLVVEGVLGKSVRFTPTESRIVAALLRSQGAICRKDGALYSAICGNRPDADWPEFKMVDVLICKVRVKVRKAFDAPIIGTTWGVGYYAERSPAKPLPEAA